MSHSTTPYAEFFEARSLAVVGVSDRDFGGIIYRTLKDRGFQVFAVHPARTTFAEDPCFPTLRDVPGNVKLAVIAVAPLTAEQVTRDAIAAGYTHLWYQQGRDCSSAVRIAEEAGLRTVSGKCILLYAGEVSGIHRFHRFLAKLFGKY